MRTRLPITLAAVGLALAGALFGAVLFKHLAHPLLWNDEALTAVFGERVLAYGYPKVHGPKNAHYPMHHDLSVGVKEGLDAYVGSPWLQYFFAAPAVAWAAGADEIYARTFRLRLPFALAGAAGVAVVLWTGLLSLEGGARRALFALLFLLLASYSVSLILHLREVRYYPLVVLFGACALHVTVRHRLRGDLGTAAYTVALAALLFLLFNTFYLAFVGLALGLGVHAVGSALREGGPAGPRLRRLAGDLLPLLVAGVAVLPLLAFYDTFGVVGAFAEAFHGPKNAYGNKLRWLLESLLRYELLAPVVAFRLAVVIQLALGGDPARPPGFALRLRLANLLGVVIVCYAPVVAAAPFFYERYSILLSPLLTLLLLLDAFSLVDLLTGAPARRRGVAIASLAVGLACLVGNLWVRLPEFRGRIAEIRHLYRGPLDFVIPHLLRTYAHPERLVIATNYEDPSLRYYLGSWVVVGWFNPDLAHDLLFDPDVIIPRAGRMHREVLTYLAERGEHTGRGTYTSRRFDVADLAANNVPSLAPWNHSRWVHHFETVRPGEDDRGALVILERPVTRASAPGW
jgi:hypothetical protein